MSTATLDSPVEVIQSATRHSRTLRIWHAIGRRLRLVYARCRHPRVTFGVMCDVRSGLSLTLGRDAVVSFGHRCVIDREMTIECDGELSIGARTIFGHHCTIAAAESIQIGADCLIAEMVSIRDHDHRFDRLNVPIRLQGRVTAPIRIGDNVWLGSKVTVVKGVSIGDNAIVGANSVVTKDIPADAVAVGAPARVIRMRNGHA